MKRLLSAIIAAALLAPQLVFAQADSLMLLGVGTPAGGGCTNPIAIDGTAHGNNPGGSVSTTTATLTTASAGDFISVWVVSSAGLAVSVTSPHLTFTQRVSDHPSSSVWAENWTAVAGSALTSEVITATESGTQFTTVDAFGASGVNTSTKFDSNGSVPATVGGLGSTVSLTTNNAADILLGQFTMTSVSTPTAGAGWTAIHGGDYQLVEYKIVCATQSGTVPAIGTGSGDQLGALGDAYVH